MCGRVYKRFCSHGYYWIWICSLGISSKGKNIILIVKLRILRLKENVTCLSSIHSQKGQGWVWRSHIQHPFSFLKELFFPVEGPRGKYWVWWWSAPTPPLSDLVYNYLCRWLLSYCKGLLPKTLPFSSKGDFLSWFPKACLLHSGRSEELAWNILWLLTSSES